MKGKGRIMVFDTFSECYNFICLSTIIVIICFVVVVVVNFTISSENEIEF